MRLTDADLVKLLLSAGYLRNAVKTKTGMPRSPGDPCPLGFGKLVQSMNPADGWLHLHKTDEERR